MCMYSGFYGIESYYIYCLYTIFPVTLILIKIILFENSEPDVGFLVTFFLTTFIEI